jgi:hypothetical protein
VAEVDMVMSRGTLLRRTALDSLIARARQARKPIRTAMDGRNETR